MRLPFATQSYNLPGQVISAQQCINFYAEREPQDAKTAGQVAMLATPGTVPFAGVIGLSGNPVRGMLVLNNILYFVAGTFLYSCNEGGTITGIGSAITDPNSPNQITPVGMASNGNQIIIVNGVSGFIWNINTLTFTQIASPNFFPCFTVTYFDGYFVCEKAGTNIFFFSALGDGLTWNALDFETAEVQSDYVVGVVNQQENLLIFGQRSIETWYDTGNNDNPFQRYDGATIERGCASPWSILKEDNSVFFLGDDGIYYRLDGVSPRRVSTHAIEAEWATYPTVQTGGLSECTAFNYTWNGHKFIYVTFQNGGASFGYDISTGMWHERNSYAGNGQFFANWRQFCSIRFFDKVLVGDTLSGTIASLSDSSYTEFGNQMIGTLVGPTYHKDRKRLFWSLFELDMQTGVGLQAGIITPAGSTNVAGADPQIMLEISRDGGRTYGNLQQWQSLGQIGEYQTRLRWKKLGQSFQFTPRITVSDPVPRRIVGAYGEISTGI